SFAFGAASSSVSSSLYDQYRSMTVKAQPLVLSQENPYCSRIRFYSSILTSPSPHERLRLLFTLTAIILQGSGGIMFTISMDEAMLREILRRLVEAIDPDRIVLFGSRARGDARPGQRSGFAHHKRVG